ncbi:MAG: acylphosphatase [Schwartzia sp.]|nr:acylphosphatase [Schwartzia sp. (in: firmicutes)]MBR1885427.1 acylphosphatase [Schwartzia sp. (in: firmicutes)]
MKMVRHAGRCMGRVQGVGFRVFVQGVARELGFTGWVKNMPDGSVVMEAQGDETLFGEFKERLQKGNGLCKVEHMTFEFRKNVEDETGFEVRK